MKRRKIRSRTYEIYEREVEEHENPWCDHQSRCDDAEDWEEQVEVIHRANYLTEQKKFFWKVFFWKKKKKNYCKKLLVDARASKTVKMSGTIDVDNIIERLLEVRGSKPGKQVNLTEKEIRCASLPARCCCSLHVIRYTLVHTPFRFYYFWSRKIAVNLKYSVPRDLFSSPSFFLFSALCTKARAIFSSQPILLELVAPIKIVGMKFFVHWFKSYYLWLIYLSNNQTIN